MKKVLSFIIVISLFSSTSCEKEKDIVLSEYIIGEWKTPTMYVYNALPAWYEIEIASSTYSIMKTNGVSSAAWPNKSYSVSDKDKTITIKTFDIEPSDIIYNVTLTDDPDMMIWTTEVDDAVTFIWQKF